jgi:hypothetical protein
MRRWLGVVAVAAVAVSIPGVVSGRPVSVARVSAASLLATVRGSGHVAYRGYAQTSGSLGLPSVGWLKDAANLLGRTSRLRIWWADPGHYRVDLLGPAGERDTYREGGVRLLWDSEHRRVTTTSADDGPHLPVPPDLTPPELARRLVAPASPAEISVGPPDRVAGRPTHRLDVRLADRRVLAGRISVWVDTASGLPLRVAVVPRGATRAVLTSGFLQVSLGPPVDATLRFVAPPDADHQIGGLPSITDLAERLPPGQLPGRLGDLVREDDMRRYGEWGASAVATYGKGYVLVAVMPVGTVDARLLLDRYASPLHPVRHRPYGDEIALRTPLLSALLFSGPDGGYALAGTVSADELDRVAAMLTGAGP